MFKLGVVRREQYHPRSPSVLDRVRASLSANRISLQLLHIALPPSGEDLELFTILMRQIWLRGGVKRTTFRRRFTDLDLAVNQLLADRFRRDSTLDVHDWAASDCVTSAEWATTLFEAFPNARLQASDLVLYLVELSDGKETFIVETDGSPVQYIRPPFVIRLNPPEPKPLIVNYLLYRAALRKLARLQVPVKDLSDRLKDHDRVTAGRLAAARLPLLHPEALALRDRDKRFTIVQHSAFEALPEPVHVIRTMNIFNRAYFSPERLGEGIRAVANSLRPGGVWIVGRTFDNETRAHNTSLFDWDGRRFVLITRFGDGSEIESLALDEIRDLV